MAAPRQAAHLSAVRRHKHLRMPEIGNGPAERPAFGVKVGLGHQCHFKARMRCEASYVSRLEDGQFILPEYDFIRPHRRRMPSRPPL